MAGLIQTAISGLKVSQLALSVTGQNIVNANTEGYSRQSVSTETTPSVKLGPGYLGSGVTATEIFRNTQQHLVDQVSSDISVLSEFDTYLTNISELDDLLASSSTSLGEAMATFFEAMNVSANDPSSLDARQLLLGQTDILADTFSSLNSRLVERNSTIDKQYDTLSNQVSTIASEIAAFNKSISSAQGATGGNLPNDLLDKRDLLIRELSEIVDVSVVVKENHAVDVFIGEAQSLVIGSTSRELLSVPGEVDPSRQELAFRTGGETQIVTRQMTGGILGGLARFRNEAVDPAVNALGRIALALSADINNQQALGIDLEGNLGNAIFSPINSPEANARRVLSNSNNAPPDDRQISVAITDTDQLTTSDYTLSFSGPGRQFSVIRQSDGAMVSQGVLSNRLPQTIEADGFELSFNGGSFQAGDRFTIQPTRFAAREIEAVVSRPEAFAYASPIRAAAGAGNQGGASIASSQVMDVATSAFTDSPGELSPPVLIRFTSETSYDVLDNSDPANPVPLRPPLSNQTFSPGVTNRLLPEDPGGTTISTGESAVTQAQLSVNGTGAGNGYQSERLTVLTTDPDTGFVSQVVVDIPEHQSAFDTANQLSGLTGVSATASTRVQLSDFTSDGGGEVPVLIVNGVELTDPALVAEGETLPQSVPDPLTSDFLRDRINNSHELSASGITATSDGETLTVRSATGEDITLALSGDNGDGLTVTDAVGQTAITGPGAGLGTADVIIGGTYEVQLAGGVEVTSNNPNGIIGGSPEASSNYLGYQVSLVSGHGEQGGPQKGDVFAVSYNNDGTADNRNGAAMVALNTESDLGDGNLSYQTAYGQLVENVGILTSQSRLSQGASESLLRQSMDALESVAGVNLDEEAARLIELEQHYNASARLISLARDLFNSLLDM